MSMPKGTIIKSDEEKHRNTYRVYLTDDELKKIWEMAGHYETGNAVITRKIINAFYEIWKNMNQNERIGLWMKY